jgi:peroxiredoxin
VIGHSSGRFRFVRKIDTLAFEPIGASMHRKILLAAMTIAVFGFGLRALADDDTVTSLVGKPSPDFSLATYDGGTVKLSDQKGKVVVLDFWGTWCVPCRQLSLPHLQELQDNKDLAAKGVVLWAIDEAETVDDVKKFLADNKYTFTIVMDPDQKGANALLVPGCPVTVVVGRDGVIKFAQFGYDDKTGKLIDDAIAKALAEPAP